MDLEQRRAWNENHKLLTGMITKPEEYKQAIELFMKQHAALYSSKMEGTDRPTFEDKLLADIREQTLRGYPVQHSDSRNSMVWHLWHSARIEDITMNILAADTEQVLHSDHYFGQMEIRFQHSGNGMNEEEIAELSSAINIEALLAYRLAVGRKTRRIIASLPPEQLKLKVDPARARRLSMEGAVLETEQWLIDYWTGKSIAGLVLMPATRHNFVHLNKAMRIKQKLQKN